MEPLYPTKAPETDEPTDGAATTVEEVDNQEPQKKDWGALVKKHWLPLLLGLVVLFLAGTYFYIQALAQQVEQEAVPLASASTNIDQVIPEAATESVAPPTPSDVKERQRQQELQGTVEEEKPSVDQVANAMVIDTVGLAEQKRKELRGKQEAARQRAIRVARAQNVDTVETTVQDPTTGSYRTAKTTVPRNRARANSSYASEPAPARRRGGAGRSQRYASAPAGLPATDIDGTPFETNPDVLAMLAASPPETRQSYERMTGRRYRALPTDAQAATGKNGTLVLPDGFNTIKVRSASQAAGGAQNDETAEALTPDIFFKCVINGEQTVRTGSVVMLRLLEDAVVSGTTFPKNMVFAGVAGVGSNNVTIQVERLGPTRVKAQIYDFNYMPGIMIDPGKRAPLPAGQSPLATAQQTGFSELSTAIDRSYSAANSAAGIAARVGAAVIQRAPRSGQKLRPVLLPDGYPILITTSSARR